MSWTTPRGPVPVRNEEGTYLGTLEMPQRLMEGSRGWLRIELSRPPASIDLWLTSVPFDRLPVYGLMCVSGWTVLSSQMHMLGRVEGFTPAMTAGQVQEHMDAIFERIFLGGVPREAGEAPPLTLATLQRARNLMVSSYARSAPPPRLDPGNARHWVTQQARQPTPHMDALMTHLDSILGPTVNPGSPGPPPPSREERFEQSLTREEAFESRQRRIESVIAETSGRVPLYKPR